MEAAENSGSEIFEISFDQGPGGKPDPQAGTIDFSTGNEPESEPVSPATPESAPELTPEAAPASSSYIKALEERVASAERVSNELNGAVRAMLAGQQRQVDPNQPPITLEQLEQNGGVKELLQYLEWHNNRNLAGIVTQADFAARRAAATQQVRGLMNKNEMGEGRDYDALRGRHLEQIYRTNPNVEALLHAAAFDNPALAEYTLASIYEIVSQVKDDPVKGFKAIWGALDAYKSGSKDTTQRLGDAFDRQANKILRGSGSPGRTVKIGSAEDITRMSDREFEQFYAQTGNS